MFTKSETVATMLGMNWSNVTEPSPELFRFAEAAAANQRPYDGAERRTEVRRSIAVAVLAKPVGIDLTPVGEPFIAVTRDISTNGMAMFYTAPVTAKYLIVEFDDFAGGRCRMFFAVLRCNPVWGYFEIGGTFLNRLPN